MTPALRRKLSGPRSTAWRFDLFDLQGNLIGKLDGVVQAELTGSVGAKIRTGGRLTWKRPPSGQVPDWLRVLVQPVYTASFYDGTSLEWPWGLFIPAVPKAAQDGSVVGADVDLYDQLLILDEDAFTETYAVPAGAIVTDVVREILADAGITRAVVEDSATTLSAAMVWEGGTSRLRVINDLLDAIGYFAIWVDGTGTFRVQPYVDTPARSVGWAFQDGATSIFVPDLSEERDRFGVPNRVVLVARSEDGTAPPLTSTADNTDPLDPLSIPGRGRVITRRYPDVEAASQEVLDQLAARYLASARTTAAVVELKHLPIPLDFVDLNAVVSYTNSTTGTTLRGAVQSWRVSTETPSLVQTTIREVA